MGFLRKAVSIFYLILILVLIFPFVHINAQTASPTPPADQQKISDLQNQINELQSKISDLENQQKTLSSQIAVMDNQIKLTQLKINSTEQQITDLALDIDTADKKINNLQNSLQKLTGVLIDRIVATYEVGTVQPFHVLISSDNVSNFFKRLNYLKIAQEHDKKLIYDTTQAKNDYSNQKEIFQDKKKQVEELQAKLKAYNDQLDQEKKSKQELLSETQGSEANYQRLLAAAKAQLAGFSRFTASLGGASLLSGQTSCDDWGCYYNQRDSQWGALSLNNTQYTLASDGCLVTSMAMVLTHYGHRGVTPITINSNSNNFASYYPAYLKYTISADGATAQRIGAAIDSTLSNGDPVVAGINAYGGTHFVVLVSGSGGNYVMNDPFIPNGKKINFSDHYSSGNIFEVDKVSVN